MNLLILGRGKTGSLVEEVARQRRHHVRVLGGRENKDACALTAECLRNVDTVIDFTTPAAISTNIAACLRERKQMVVGTTGWHSDIAAVRHRVEEAGTGFLCGANFSIPARAAAARTTSHAPSGTSRRPTGARPC